MWYLYILRCSDDSLYTGITTDVEKRIKAHRGEIPGGAKYLRGRAPFELVFQVEAGTKSDASKLELRVKKLTRRGKEALLEDASLIEKL